MKAGDKIKVEDGVWGWHTNDWVEYTVEEFRYCLGIFQTEADRIAGNFTPLCELYERGPESEQKYIPNYGEYTTNKVQAWINVAEG